jgi:gluconate:H+ symporter, GntP family
MTSGMPQRRFPAAGFWLVKESFGMTMGEATMTISLIHSVVAPVGLGMVLLMNLLPARPS